jgi:hypothetical protein
MLDFLSFWNKAYDQMVLMPQMAFLGACFNIMTRQYMDMAADSVK